MLRNINFSLLAVRRVTVVAAFVVTAAACQSTDARFENAPTVSAHDITSHNVRRRAEPQAPPQIPDEPTAAPIPRTPPRAGGMPPAAGRQPLPVDHPPMAESPPAVPTNSPVQPDANSVGYTSISDYGKTGPLRWVAPPNWKAERPANSFRIAEYIIPGRNGTHSATMSIFHFPSGAGGIQANISRWLSQFTPSEGEIDPQKATSTMMVAGLKVWRVEAEGLFNPGMMAGGGSNDIREDYALEAAIVETPVGPFFFKLVGPRPTIEGSRDEFNWFVQSFRSAGDSPNAQ